MTAYRRERVLIPRTNILRTNPSKQARTRALGLFVQIGKRSSITQERCTAYANPSHLFLLKLLVFHACHNYLNLSKRNLLRLYKAMKLLFSPFVTIIFFNFMYVHMINFLLNNLSNSKYFIYLQKFIKIIILQSFDRRQINQNNNFHKSMKYKIKIYIASRWILNEFGNYDLIMMTISMQMTLINARKKKNVNTLSNYFKMNYLELYWH